MPVGSRIRLAVNAPEVIVSNQARTIDRAMFIGIRVYSIGAAHETTVCLSSGCGGSGRDTAGDRRGACLVEAPGRRSGARRESQETKATPDISGFWELNFDGRKVPRANLLPTVTRAKIDARAKADAYAIRWCNLLGLPFVMDPGRPLDIRQGMTAVSSSARTRRRRVTSIPTVRSTSAARSSIRRRTATRSPVGKVTRWLSTRSVSTVSTGSRPYLVAASAPTSRGWLSDIDC